jgi:uncharacterized protein with ATP-grasp and redox domains
MKTFYECLPCFITQTITTLARAGADDDRKKVVFRAIFRELACIDFESNPPAMAMLIHRIIRRETNCMDPFYADKKRYNEFAQSLLEHMREGLFASDTFETRVRLAIAANIIDFGKNANLAESEVMASFEKAMRIPIDVEACNRLYQAIGAARRILFLCDNAGEIVFDKYLIEMLPKEKITCVVRGFPVINDATIEDAGLTGLDSCVEVIDNGSDAPGTILGECSDSLRQRFNDADLVIAKGQGNFETMSEIRNKRIFFLLQAKCAVVARDIGCETGSFVILENSRK